MGGTEMAEGMRVQFIFERNEICPPFSTMTPRSARSALVAQSTAALRSSTVTGALPTLATIFTPVILREAARRKGLEEAHQHD